jgi:acyl CoA:acetate/3-ketoacid CoA transferase alpha subunit
MPECTPRVALVVPNKADRHANLCTRTNTIVKAAACSSVVVVAQVNEIVEHLAPELSR